MIHFQCDKCGQKMKVEDIHEGKKVKCLKCPTILTIPSLSPISKSIDPVKNNTQDIFDSCFNDEKGGPDNQQNVPENISPKEETKSCPFCGESILKAAKKCKHCGEYFNKDNNNSFKKNNYHNELLGILMLIIPIAASIFVYFWIDSMDIIHNTASIHTAIISVRIVAIFTVISTTILMTLESTKLRMGDKINGKREQGPISWFICGILFWILTYPIYLYKRGKYGLVNYCLFGFMVALVFVASLGYTTYGIGKIINTPGSLSDNSDPKIQETIVSIPQKSEEQFFNFLKGKTYENPSLSYGVDQVFKTLGWGSQQSIRFTVITANEEEYGFNPGDTDTPYFTMVNKGGQWIREAIYCLPLGKKTVIVNVFPESIYAHIYKDWPDSTREEFDSAVGLAIKNYINSEGFCNICENVIFVLDWELRIAVE